MLLITHSPAAVITTLANVRAESLGKSVPQRGPTQSCSPFREHRPSRNARTRNTTLVTAGQMLMGQTVEGRKGSRGGRLLSQELYC
jgi:hypothetical protein